MIGMVAVAPRLIGRFGPKVMTVAGLATLAAVSQSQALGWAAAAVGLFGVTCSVLIYTTTRRWSYAAVIARFTFTTALGGLLVVAWAALAPTWPAAVAMAT